MNALSRLVLCTAALAAALGAASASAQVYSVGKLSALRTSPVVSLAKPSISVYNRGALLMVTKSCLATYDPNPGSPRMHFMATKICAAPSNVADGSACTCPVTVNGQPVQAHGTVHTDTGGPSTPAVH